MAKIARWFIDITLDSETLRWWSGTGNVTLDSNTYTGLGTRFITPESLTRKGSLKSEKIELEFDSSRQSDNSDPIGYLLDQTWRNRQVRLRRIAWEPGTDPSVDGTVLADERGRLRDLVDSFQQGKPPLIMMEIESGALAYLERRMETRSPASQKAAFAGDEGFDLIARLEGTVKIWRTKEKKSGTVRTQRPDEYEPYPRELQVGRFATEGSFVADFTNGQQKKYAQSVYAIADHRIKALDRVWINGDQVVSTPLAHGVRTLVRLEGDKGEDRCWVTLYDGRPDQTADSYLVSMEPTWTTSHRLRGVAYIIVEHLWDSDLPSSFSYRFGGQGGYFYDRRQDSTQGGSGSQRWDQPLTWGYTTNAAVVADHYRAGIRVVAGSTRLWFGVGELLDAVPYAEFEALADLCDEGVALKYGGTQKRYEVNGTISGEKSHDKNLQALADQMAARAIDQGGRISFRPPVVRPPVITLTDGDRARGSASIVKPGGRIEDMVNTLGGQFINPANDFKKDEYPEVSVAAYIEADNGEIGDTLNLELENSGERAQRIAKLKIEDSRRILQIEETFGAKASVIEPGDWFTRESVLRGFPSGKQFIADEVTRYIDGSVEIVATEVDPDQLVWDEETAVDLSVPPAYPQIALVDLEVPGGTATPRQIIRNDVNLPGVDIEIEYGPDPLPYSSDVEVTLDGGSGGPLAGAEVLRRHLPAGSTVLTLSGELTPKTDYVYRARANFDGRIGAWSDWKPFTTGSYAVPAGSAAADSALAAALEAGASGREKIAEIVLSAITRIEDVRANLDKLAKIDGVPVATKIQQIRNEVATLDSALAQDIGVLASRLEDAEAAIVSEREARSDADSAAAAARQLIQSNLDDAQASFASEINTLVSDLETVIEEAELLEARVTNTESGQQSLSTALSGAVTRITQAEDTLTSLATDFVDLSSELDGAKSDIAAAATARQAIQTQVTQNASGVTSLSQQYSQLLSRVTNAEGDITANASAYDGLLAYTNNINGDVSAVSSRTTDLESQVGNVSASLTIQAQAVATIEDAAAYYNVILNASGSDPAIVEMKAGKNGSSVGIAAKVLRLINIVGGGSVEVMRAVGGYVFFSNPISVSVGGKRLTLGPNGDVVLWFGPSNIDPPNQTRTNGHWAFGTDGKVYYGNSELFSESTVFRATASRIGTYVGTATGDVQCQNVPIDVFNGSPPYYFGNWQIVNAPPGASITSGGSAPSMRAGNLQLGQTLTAVITTTVTDSTGNSAQVGAAFRWTNIA